MVFRFLDKGNLNGPNHLSSAASSSLRKTPLRNSIDSYNRLLEVHRHTIDKIAHEVSRLVCACRQLDGTDWNDYERNSDVIQLGLTGYAVVPVTCNKAEQKNYTAWVRHMPIDMRFCFGKCF